MSIAYFPPLQVLADNIFSNLATGRSYVFLDQKLLIKYLRKSVTDTGTRMIFHLTQISVFPWKTDVIENINIKHSVSENIRYYLFIYAYLET